MRAQPGWGLQALDRCLGLCTQVFFWLGGIAVVLLVLLTVTAVFWRYALNDPIFGVEDASMLLLILVAAASVVVGARSGSHVSIDIGDNWIGPRARAAMDAVMRLLTVGILGLACYALIDKACGPERACITSNLNVAHRPFYYTLAAAMAVVAIGEALALCRAIIGDAGNGSHEAAD